MKTLILSILAFTFSFSIHAIEKKGEIALRSGEKLSITLSISPAEQEQGLSGIRSKDYKNNQGMLFFNLDDNYRRFWMPDTYFDLDIFFLDKDLRILDVERNVKHYIGRKNPSKIPTTRTIMARHVLEVKSQSPLAKKMKKGDSLKWVTTPSLEQIEQDTRRNR